MNSTKDNIVKGFWNLYKERRIEDITIKEIMREAGYNRTTFYMYFKDKYEILSYFEDKLIENITKYMKTNFSINNFNDDLVRLIASIYDNNGIYLSILLSNRGDPLFINKLKKAIKQCFYDNINRNTKIDITLEFSISAVISSFTFWYQNKSSMSSYEFVKTLNYLLTNNIKEELSKYFSVY